MLGNNKYSIKEDKTQRMQAEYLFPDLALRKSFKKVSRIFAFTMLGLGCLYVGLLIAVSQLADADLAGRLIGIAFGVFVALIIADGIVVSILQRKITKHQFALLKDNPDKNTLYIKLHELKIPFTRKWNVLFVVLTFGAIVSNILLNLLASLIIKPYSYGWIFLLLFFVEFIVMFVAYFRAYAKIRQEMIPIEDTIDKTAYTDVNELQDNK